MKNPSVVLYIVTWKDAFQTRETAVISDTVTHCLEMVEAQHPKDPTFEIIDAQFVKRVSSILIDTDACSG